MKKTAAVIMALMVSFVSLFAQSQWGEKLDWKSAFLTHTKAMNKTLDENQEMLLMFNFYNDDFREFHNDEFEWEDVKAKDMKDIYNQMNAMENYTDTPHFIVTGVKFGNYDFDKEGYTVSLPAGSYFSLEKPYRYDKRDHYNSVSSYALFFNDYSEYNFIPMKKADAKAFQNARKDVYGDINKNILLLIHYTMEDFNSDKYASIAPMFDGSGYIPVVGNISSIEVFAEDDSKIGDLIKK